MNYRGLLKKYLARVMDETGLNHCPRQAGAGFTKAEVAALKAILKEIDNDDEFET